jgi:hypothetical protein
VLRDEHSQDVWVTTTSESARRTEPVDPTDNAAAMLLIASSDVLAGVHVPRIYRNLGQPGCSPALTPRGTR